MVSEKEEIKKNFEEKLNELKKESEDKINSLKANLNKQDTDHKEQIELLRKSHENALLVKK